MGRPEMRGIRSMAWVVPLGVWLLLAPCAAGAVPGGAAQYGDLPEDASKAVGRGEGRQALAYYEALASELERGDPASKVEAAKAYILAASVARSLGALQKAIRYGLRAQEILDGVPENRYDVRWLLRAHSVLGHSYARVGAFEEARREFTTVLALLERFTDARHLPPLARLSFGGAAWGGLAWVAYRQGDYPRAVDEGKKAIRLDEDFQAWGPAGRRRGTPSFQRAEKRSRYIMAATLITVGRAQWQLKRPDDAEASFRRAMAVAKDVAGEELEAIALAGLSEVTYGRGDPLAGEGQAKDALRQATRLKLAPVEAWIRSRLAGHAAASGRHLEALQDYRGAMDLLEDMRSQLQEAGLRSLFLEDKQAVYYGAVHSALAIGQIAEAFSYGERARARAFLDLLGNETTLSKGKTRALVDEEVRLRDQLTEAQAAAEDAAGGDDAARAHQQVAAAERAYRAFLDRVRAENVEQGSLMSVEPVTLQEVQGLLPEGTTLLEYLLTETDTILWVVDRQQAVAVRMPVARRDLVGQVRAFRQAIARRAPLPQVQDQARALYERLLAPARPHIRGARLLVVPHGVLHYLPFAALRTPEGRWVMEDYPLATLPSASVLKYLQDKGAGAGTRALAVGNPDLGSALNLRYAEREARAVAAHYPGATLLVRQDATETQVKALSGTAGLLHLATHAELNGKDPLASALLLVPSGPDDGRLEVRKIFGLDLHARLVVLSACETGAGQLSRGDELVSLQRAFLYAGTPAVVTTLWKVDDRASFRLMEAFYDALETRGPAEALRQAQRTTLTEFPHPFAWAAFGLTGAPW